MSKEPAVKTKTIQTIDFVTVAVAAVFLLAGIIPSSVALASGENSSPALGAAQIDEKAQVQVAQANVDFSGLGQITEVAAEKDGDEVSIKIKTTRSIDYTAFKLMDPLRLILDFPGMGPSSLNDDIAVNEGVVSNIHPLYFEDAKVQRLEIGLTQAASYEIIKSGPRQIEIRLAEASIRPASIPSSSTLEMQAGGMQSALYAQGSGKGDSDTCQDLLSGEKDKISLEFQNATLKNIFRFLSEVSGFSVVFSPDVEGMATIKLSDVAWNTALELILENNALGRVCEQNIVRIAPKATLAAAKELDPLVTEMVRISYADIEEMVKNLESIKSKDRGSITADIRTNTLILTDISPKIDEMVSIIRILDVRTPQVQIEAKIVEITRDYAKAFGVRWRGFSQRESFNSGSFPSVVRVGTRQSVRVQDPTEPPGGLDFFSTPLPGIGDYLVDLGVAGATTIFGIDLTTRNLDHKIELELQALEEQGKSRTLANPKVTTLDNKEAVIKAGRRIPYQTFTAKDGAVTKFIDADIRLTVTPHITADENIFMKVAALQNSAIGFSGPGGLPTIVTKEVKTEVLVADGATTVLGGLFQKNTTESKGSVPYLSQIPILGYLFKNSQDADAIKELLIFVTPTIVRDVNSSGL